MFRVNNISHMLFLTLFQRAVDLVRSQCRLRPAPVPCRVETTESRRPWDCSTRQSPDHPCAGPIQSPPWGRYLYDVLTGRGGPPKEDEGREGGCVNKYQYQMQTRGGFPKFPENLRMSYKYRPLGRCPPQPMSLAVRHELRRRNYHTKICSAPGAALHRNWKCKKFVTDQLLPVYSNLLNGSAVLSSKNWTNKQIEPFTNKFY